MNYKNIIDLIKTICDNHYFINQFGYGDISDISTPDDNEAPDYPYVFLNPVTFNMGDKITSFNFNLITICTNYYRHIWIIERYLEEEFVFLPIMFVMAKMIMNFIIIITLAVTVLMSVMM